MHVSCRAAPFMGLLPRILEDGEVARRVVKADPMRMGRQASEAQGVSGASQPWRRTLPPRFRRRPGREELRTDNG